MPELPEVEVTRMALSKLIVGRKIQRVEVRQKHLRYEVCEESLQEYLSGASFKRIRRRAKYLLLDFHTPHVLLIHLGMTGNLRVCAARDAVGKHDHIVWYLDGADCLVFRDVRRFGWADAFHAHEEAMHPKLRHLGIEPLSSALTAAWMFEATRTSRAPIKNFIMKSERVVGIGNIYASESLFAAGLHPQKAASALTFLQCADLVDAIKKTLHAAIGQGGTTLRDFSSADGQQGYFALKLSVYGRAGQPCRVCAALIDQTTLAGRSSYFCPSCQN